MLQALGYPSLDALIDDAVPSQIRLKRPLQLPAGQSEHEVLSALKEIASQNQVFRSCIGMGYSDCFTPAVIQRNLLENPGWYTQYTPYQAEIAQGRLEALLNFQTVIIDLTGLEVANSSLLDEATAAAEAMSMCHGLKDGRNIFFVSENCHPQTIDVVKTRAKALGIEIVTGDHEAFQFNDQVFGSLVQYPDTFGSIHDYSKFIERAHASGALVGVAADLLALIPAPARSDSIPPPAALSGDRRDHDLQRLALALKENGGNVAAAASSLGFSRHRAYRLLDGREIAEFIASEVPRGRGRVG